MASNPALFQPEPTPSESVRGRSTRLGCRYARAAQEARHGVGDEAIDLLCLHHPPGDQGSDALHGGEEDEADALGLPRARALLV